MKKIITILALLCALLPSRAQYMSFFGDSTWEYHVVVVSQPPENYLEFPPENPSPLSVYCQTFSFRFNKNQHPYGNSDVYMSGIGGDYDVDSLIWDYYCALIHEDTLYGRLYNGSILICDMSLSEGDTFCLRGGGYYPDYNMFVDSVRIMAGRKMIFLSLIDQQDDYFFGTAYNNQHPDLSFPIRFIEGIGPSYGINPWGAQIIPPAGCHYHQGFDFLTYLLCMHKDGTLEYLANESLGCVQTCVGLNNYPDISTNLYPNPATQYVVLDMGTGEEMNGWVAIMDMLGKQCHQQKAIGTSIRISVADLPTGMYFLTYTDGKKKVTRKFLKK